MSAFLRCRPVFGLSMIFPLFFLATANASVMTQLQGRQLHVVGDSQSNNVTISAARDWIVVTSTDSNPVSVHKFPTTSVDGITVDTMRGADDIIISSTLRPGVGRENPITVRVFAGADDDKIQLSGYWGDTDIRAASGADTIDVGNGATRIGDGAKINGRLTISAGTASDTISLSGVVVGGKTRIKGGADDDTFALLKSNFGDRFHLRSGDGDDVVFFMDMQKRTSAPFVLRGGTGNNDSLSGNFDLTDVDVSGFEAIEQLPDEPILITAVDRSVSVQASYSSEDQSLAPPDDLIEESRQDTLSTDQSGSWDEFANVSILERYDATGPISASAGQTSDASVSGGTLDIGLFADGYWRSPLRGHNPVGSANSSSDYEVTFRANREVTLTVDGYLLTNRSIPFEPMGMASLRIVERGATDTILVRRQVEPESDVMFNELVETLDGTSIVLDAGKTYSIVVVTRAYTDEAFNGEAEAKLVWSIN